MSLLGRLGGLFGGRKAPETRDEPAGNEAERLLRTILDEAVNASDHWQKKLTDSPRWAALKADPAALQIDVMLAALNPVPNENKLYAGSNWQVENLRNTMISQIVRRDLPFSAGVLTQLLSAWSKQRYGLEMGLPGRAMLGAVERHMKTAPLDAGLRDVLRKLRAMANRGAYGGSPSKVTREIADRIDRLLDGTTDMPKLPAGRFAAHWQSLMATRASSEQPPWQALALHCASSAAKGQPSSKWQATGTAMLAGLDRAQLSALIIGLLAEVVPDPGRIDDSLDILKGLIWLTPQLDHAELAGPVGRFAELCFRKVPNQGARSVSLGNACLWALSAMADGPHATAELFRLQAKIKYPSAQGVIAKRLAALADSSGQSIAALEDIGLPDHGLDETGRRVEQLAGFTATITLTATDTSLDWQDATGKPLKAVPAAVRTGHKADLAAIRKALADIEAARAGQVLRLEASWVERRDWALADWQAHYLGHRLRRPIVEALLWDIGGTIVLPRGNRLETLDGSDFNPPADARVRLWHSLLSPPATVLAWRERIITAGLTQPIRQAHREIYVLTDAERATDVYSNRFAAHILRQHQFRALCQARGWRYGLMGQWDSMNWPERPLPAHGLTAEYLVQAVENGEASASGILMHVATDQLRFLDAQRQPVPLAQVDPLLLSEMMRDCDLFVAVTSVANDPGWADGGPAGRFGHYWNTWAFGDLGQSALMRRDLIARIAPRLAIAAQLEVGDKALIVTGKRHRYAIHFGSSNIQILPGNRYLCIVPDSAPPEARNLALPFAGDNLVSIILAKAFLLADESKITDKTILSQL